MNYTLDNNTSVTKIKTAAKADMVAFIMEKLAEAFGEDSVAMVRTGGTTKTNEIGVVIGSVDKNGEALPLVMTINPAVKEFESRSTAKKVYTAFDFAEAKAAYENYLADKAEKATDKAKATSEVAERKTADASETENDNGF